MKRAEIKALLWEIAKRYPRFQGLLQKRVGDETQGSIWVSDLYRMELDSGYLTDVCHDYIELRKDLPNPIDNIVKEIADEVRRLQYQDQRRLELHLQANQPPPGELMKIVGSWGIGKVAIDIGVAAKNKQLTENYEQQLGYLLFCRIGKTKTACTSTEVPDGNAIVHSWLMEFV